MTDNITTPVLSTHVNQSSLFGVNQSSLFGVQASLNSAVSKGSIQTDAVIQRTRGECPSCGKVCSEEEVQR